MKLGRKPKNIDFSLGDAELLIVMRAIGKKGSVSIAGLGLFEIVEIKPRKLYHNTGKRVITTKAYKKLKYTPSKTIKSLINA